MKKINDIPIDYYPELEKISIVVLIMEIEKDHSHPAGYQVVFQGELYAVDGSVEIVNLFKEDGKQYVEELVSTVLTGSFWLITGEHIIDMESNTIILFPESYQAVAMPQEESTTL